MKKRLVSIILAICLLVSVVATLSACAKDSNAYEYEIWTSTNENAFYTDYNENLALRYLNTLQFEGADGDLHNTNLKFITASGSPRDEFNNMISNGNYYDVMDLGQSSYTAKDLYSDGMLIDLTPYMEDCMPNYLKWLENNPDYAKTAVDDVDGQKKYLQIYSYHDFDENVWGWQYRRDWIAKYGKDKDGNAFTYSYDENGILTDNIVFPSYYNVALRNSYNELLRKNGMPEWDGKDPVFISDWEWMLGIFKDVLKQKGVANGNSPSGETGYPMSLYYPGYVEMGDLVCAFGGNSANFYADEEGTIHFGLTEPHFKDYLKMMNVWYNNGWVDSKFDERNDVHYQIDTVNMYAGRVGLFYGNPNTPLNKLAKDGDKFTEGYYAAPARQPINDTYGTDYKYTPSINEFLPRVFYSPGREFVSFVFTNRLEDNGKDIQALLRAIDHLYEESYTDENGVLQPGGALLTTAGLTKEQYEKVKFEGDYYSKTTILNGKTIADDGAIRLSDDGTEFVFCNGLGSDDNWKIPAMLNRFIGLQVKIDRGRTEAQLHIFEEWDFYTSHSLRSSFLNQLDTKESEKYNTFLDNVRTDVSSSRKDVIMADVIKSATWDETKYETVMFNVNLRKPKEIIGYLQVAYDKFYK